MTVELQQDTGAMRSLTSQLADDLGWLENHCRKQADQNQTTGQLRYAAALIRNVIGPFLDHQAAQPLYLAVVGGAGAGKSTVSNFLAGALVAESNPQAGFTRHPVAYIDAESEFTWPAHLGFLGPLKRLTQPTPSSLDEDVYQIRKVPLADQISSALKRFVIWDCPDMTTSASGHYIPRLLEVTALADVVVYVASDERYNDEVPTQYLHMLVESGKPVICCLLKMSEVNAAAFLDHFRQEVLGKLQAGHIPCLAIPFLKPEELANPFENARRYQIPLLNQVSVLGDPPEKSRLRTVQAAMHHLTTHQDRLLKVVRADLQALQIWRNVVQEGQIEFDNRYRREYLTSERFHRFDEALVRFLQLLELPGIGKYLSQTLYVIRTPYRLLRGLFNKAMQRPPAPPVPELPVLEQAMRGWIDMLRKEAARRGDNHLLWQHVDKGFDSGLADLAMDRFQQGVRAFHLSQADEIDRTARAIYEELEKNPLKLNTLRGTKFALEMGAITGTVIAGGINWFDFVLAPLAASVTHHLVEIMGKQYVDSQREQARTRQMALVTQYISGPEADWLTQWPSTGGSDFERLQLALKRIPAGIQQLDAAVRRTLEGKGEA